MKDRPHIMVVDDDREMLRLLKRVFELEGYDVTTAADGSSALALLGECKQDLVILDIVMPGPDGYQVLEAIRQGSDIPVIMLTARCDVTSLHKALALGADDYVKKPFRPLELMARVQAKLRRAKHWDERLEPTFYSHDLVIDFVGHRVTLDNKEVKLTATEYRLLSYLVHNAGQVVTPDQILETVWGEKHSGANHLLQVNIARLRQKLGDDTRNPRHILTRHGQGYMVVKQT